MSAPSAHASTPSTPADLGALAAAAPSADAAGVRPRDVDQVCVDTIRMLAVDMTNAANSGHPGMPMGMADVAHVLWTQFLRYDPKDPALRDRDRFVLSAGHGSALIYAMLHLSGYDLPMAEIRRFRQFGSRTPGHPEHGMTPGVEVTTGPLGQGIANAVGIALAQKMVGARFGAAVASGRVYAIVGDGCLMEGISAEAASIAGHWRLGNLKVCYDSNRISIDGSTDIAFSEDVAKRFEAHGWHVVACDGHDRAAVAAAITAANAVTDRPSLVVCRTVIGKGSPNRQGSEKAHGAPLGPDETKLTKAAYGWPMEPTFLVPREAYERYAARETELRAVRAEWDRNVAAWRASDAAAAARWDAAFATDGLTAAALLETLAKGAPFGSKATRQHSQAIQQKVAAEVPNLVGGSADLTHSNLTLIDGAKPVGLPTTAPEYSGRNIFFGVREHSMGAIANGMAAHGAFVPYTATFFAFLDYMRAPVRLASLSHHGVVFVFSHDSIGLGEDG
ncbi:MAG: transketolase, partial [Planctomycetes bacterium]|nr:transketolase [Planctomycetota bacterium]